MSGDKEYSYDMESTEYNSLDYQFMADFEESEEKAEEGLYQLGFIASDSSERSESLPDGTGSAGGAGKNI